MRDQMLLKLRFLTLIVYKTLWEKKENAGYQKGS